MPLLWTMNSSVFQHLQGMGLDPAHSHLSQIFQMVGMNNGKPRKKPVPGMWMLGVHCFF